MTSDRQEQNPDEAENGVLSDTGSVDTSGLGILGGSTAQVNVELPTESDDDLEDDGVIDGEVPFVVEIPADAPFVVEIPAETAEAEIIEPESADEIVPDDESDAETVVEIEDIADAELVEDAPAAAEAQPSEPEWVPEMEHEPEAADTAADTQTHVEADAGAEEESRAQSVAAEAAADASAVESDAAGTAPALDAPATVAATVEDEADEPTPSVAATFDAFVAGGAARAAAGVPVTRREASHTGTVDRVERPPIRPEVALTSKRLGEFEADRETADLLTADRLLDPHQVVKSEPEGYWQHLVYSLSGRRINLGDGKRARARKDLDRRIAAPLSGGARFVPVLSRKGGVGKTTVTTLLGMALADARDDRVIAVDANPDRGTLAERIARSSGKTVRDLIKARGDVVGFNDLSNIVARDETRLDVVASDSDPRVSEAFSDADYHDVASLAAHYYSIVLTDTGTGIVHSVMGATLGLADQLVIVAGLSVDEARLASETLTWLETNGYADKVRAAVVVLNNARPGHPIVQLEELEAHFRTRVRAVVRVPYDPHIAAGSAIVYRDLQPSTREAARELAATVVEGLRVLAPAA